MQRRRFFKRSALGASLLMGKLGVGGSTTRPNIAPEPSLPEKPAIYPLVEIPGTSFETTDGLTRVMVTVTLGDFLISAAQLTQREFEPVMGFNPSFHQGPDLPVETVTWWEAIRYCNLRSRKENFVPCYDLESGSCDLEQNGYRLPTDAEWTYAAAMGSIGALESLAANLGSPDTKSVEHLLKTVETSGTKPVGSYPPNRFGLYDMFGNVWEWCNDYFDPLNTVQASYNLAGPLRGLARIVRGGSFLSTTSSDWARGYRSSMEPDYKSRFTGFRVCRTKGQNAVLPAPHHDPKWFNPYRQPPAGFENATGDLSALASGISTVGEWESRRKQIKAKWLKLLGSMEISPNAPRTRLIQTINDRNYTAKLMYLQVEPDYWEKILIMMPCERLKKPRPAVIVPFYDVDTPAARDLSGREFMGAGVDSYAYSAAQKGYIAVAIRWCFESYGESYSEAVANLKLRHPHCAGLGKWTWDAQRLVDYLFTLPEVDHERIGIIGHSLGGKMALYASAFDERITAVVSNEGGIGLAFSNYEDYWYFGDFIQKQDKETDQHELLGLIAPRPFLLLGGDAYDTAKSWYYVNAAQQVYDLYRKPQNIGYFNHHKGHMPTPEAVWRAMEWLAHFLGPPQ